MWIPWRNHIARRFQSAGPLWGRVRGDPRPGKASALAVRRFRQKACNNVLASCVSKKARIGTQMKLVKRRAPRKRVSRNPRPISGNGNCKNVTNSMKASAKLIVPSSLSVLDTANAMVAAMATVAR